MIYPEIITIRILTILLIFCKSISNPCNLTEKTRVANMLICSKCVSICCNLFNMLLINVLFYIESFVLLLLYSKHIIFLVKHNNECIYEVVIKISTIIVILPQVPMFCIYVALPCRNQTTQLYLICIIQTFGSFIIQNDP